MSKDGHRPAWAFSFRKSVSQTPFFIFAALLLGLTAICSGIGHTLLDTVAMETIPEKWHGRYFGLTSTVSNTIIGISMFFTGVALEWFEPRLVGLIGGIMYLVVGALFLVWSLRYSLHKEKRKLMEKAV